jgi:hypothetical protein
LCLPKIPRLTQELVFQINISNQFDLSPINPNHTYLNLSDEITSFEAKNDKKLRQLHETRTRISFRLLWLAPFLASPLGAGMMFEFNSTAIGLQEEAIIHEFVHLPSMHPNFSNHIQ